MPTEILNLTWNIQVAVASGYAAYIVSYRGIRSHHSAQDQIFLALVFSLLATASLYLWRNHYPIVQGVVAFVFAMTVAILWRRRGIASLSWVMRAGDTSWSDDSPSAWSKLLENKSYHVSQISVHLKDGTWLRCDDTSQFDKEPFGPCVLGTNGDILMYLTSTDDKNNKADEGKEREQTTVIDGMFGSRITYIPSGEISMVNLRLK